MLRTCSYRVVNSLMVYDCHIYSFKNFKLLAANAIFPSYKKFLSTNKPKNDLTTDGYLRRVLNKIPFLNLSKSKLKVTAYLLYELVADRVNYEEFFEKYSLPDTFYSWFAITELHVWMLSVRAMAEGDDGRFTRNVIIQAMWSDVNTRTKKLGAANPAEIRVQVSELYEQFNAALIAYDEGLLTSDVVLAGAIWRRLFQYNCDNPQHLESLIIYIRKQIKMLDSLSRQEFLEQRKVKWLPL